MSETDFGVTPALICQHCGNRTPLTRKAEYSTIKTHFLNENDPRSLDWDAGDVYEIAICPTCDGVSLTKYTYHEFFEDSTEYKVLYPDAQSLPDGLPKSIQKEYEAAQIVKNVSANAFGVLLRRVLELVCIDRNANGKTLYLQLQDLATRGEIPANLVNVANGLRDFGNVGAHATLGELTKDEVALLDALSRAVLEYVYSAPLLAKKAQDRLARLKSKKLGST